MRHLRRALLASVLMLLATLAAVVDAGACSCRAIDPRDQLAQSDAAVIGTVVDGSAGLDDSSARVRVARAFKADLGAEVEIDTGRDDGTCGIDLEKGDRVGLFLSRREGGGWSTGSCQSSTPEELERAQTDLPPESSREPAAFIARFEVAGTTGALVDARGGVIRYLRDERRSIESVCPGGERVVERVTATPDARTSGLEVRRLGDAAVERVVGRLHAEYGDVACLDRGASRIAVLESDGREPTPRSRLLVLGPGGRRTIHRGTAVGMTVIGGRAYLDEGFWGRDLVSVDLATGRERRIGRTVPLAGGWAVSADGRRLASVSQGETSIRGVPPPTLVVVTLGPRPRVRRLALGRYAPGTVTWAGEDRLVYGGGGDRLALFDARPRRLKRWPGRVDGRFVVSAGGRVFGLSGDRVQEVDTRTGRVRTLFRLPTEQTYDVLPLPGATARAAERPPASLRTLTGRVGRLCSRLS